MSAPAGYIQLPSGFWVGPDGSGPYFVNVATGTAQAVGGAVAYTWANRPGSAALGDVIRVTDIGPTEGTLMSWDGTYWRVTAPTCVLFDTTSADGALSGSAQIVKTYGPVPAGLLRAGRFFRIQGLAGKDGTTDAVSSMGLKIGTAGTTADTTVSTITNMSAGSRSIAHSQEWWVSSATQLTFFGPINALGYSGSASGLAFPQANTIANVDSSALYVSLVCTMAGTTNKPQSHQLRLEICP